MSRVVTSAAMRKVITNMTKPRTASQRAATLPVAMPARGITTTSAKPPAVSASAGVGGVVAQQLLHELRLQHGVGVEHAAHQRHQKAADGEVLESEQLQVDERIFLPPLPHHQADHAADKQEREELDEAGGEPVVLFALVEHDLQPAHGDGEEGQAHVIHVAQPGAVGLDPRRIVDHAA